MSMAMKYALKKRMAQGGMAYQDECPDGREDRYAEGGDVKKNYVGETHEEAKRRVSEQKKKNDEYMESLKKARREKEKSRGYAEGGDVIDRIMAKRYSEGGEIANDTPPEADFESNDFDVLANDDDLEFHDTGRNSGDEDGGLSEDDMIDRIMLKRKKDRNPVPA